MPSPSPSAPRTADILAQAVECLRAWDDGRTLQEVIPRGPAHDLLQNGLFTLFRKRAAIDWILGRLVQRPPRPRLRRLLQWAACDYLYLHGVLPQVLADQCVDYVKNSGNHSEAGFVNAVLRQLLRTPAEQWLAQTESAEAPPAVRLGLSPELAALWLPRFAPEELAKLASLLQTPAPIMVRLKTGRTEANTDEHRQTRTDTATPPHSHTVIPPFRPLPSPDFAPDTRLFEVVDAATFFASVAFKNGDYYVQDPSTLLAPAMLAVKPGEAVADLCCAPGGKSLLLAEALWGRGKVHGSTVKRVEGFTVHGSTVERTAAQRLKTPPRSYWSTPRPVDAAPSDTSDLSDQSDASAAAAFPPGTPEPQLGQRAAAAGTDTHGPARTDTDASQPTVPPPHCHTATPPHHSAGSLTCADRSEARLARVRENLAGFTGITYAVADAAKPPFPPASFDAVLLDVPCSNSGVIRRRPDVRWRFTRQNLRELIKLQTAILHGAAALVRPGGRLVYSTCSIEWEENAEQVRRFLADHPEFTLAADRQLLPAELHDGAYAALLVRKP